MNTERKKVIGLNFGYITLAGIIAVVAGFGIKDIKLWHFILPMVLVVALSSGLV